MATYAAASTGTASAASPAMTKTRDHGRGPGAGAAGVTTSGRSSTASMVVAVTSTTFLRTRPHRLVRDQLAEPRAGRPACVQRRRPKRTGTRIGDAGATVTTTGPPECFDVNQAPRRSTRGQPLEPADDRTRNHSTRSD